jgi:hypothetical protein
MASAPSLIGEVSRVKCVAAAKRAVRSGGGSGSRTVIVCSLRTSDLGLSRVAAKMLAQKRV